MTNEQAFANTIPVGALINVDGKIYKLDSEIRFNPASGRYSFAGFRQVIRTGKFSGVSNYYAGSKLEPVRG